MSSIACRWAAARSPSSRPLVSKILSSFDAMRKKKRLIVVSERRGRRVDWPSKEDNRAAAVGLGKRICNGEFILGRYLQWESQNPSCSGRANFNRDYRQFYGLQNQPVAEVL